MFCENCGNKLENDAKFCENCGNKVINKSAKFSVAPNPVQKNFAKASDQFSQYSLKKISLNDFLANVNKIVDIILMWFVNIFSKNHRIYNEDSQGSACSTPQAYVLTPSYKMDLSFIKPKFTKSPYVKLCGTLGVIVYGGLIFCGVLAIATIILVVQKFVDILWFFGTSDFNISVLIFGIFYFISYSLLLFLCFLFSYKFFYKVKNKEVDFLHYLYKASLWCIIVYAIRQFTAYVFNVVLLISVLSVGTSSLSNSLVWYAINTISSIYEIIPKYAVTVLIIICCLFLVSIYFCKSIHVRTYMGTDAYLRLSQFTRTVLSPIPDGGKEDMNEELCNTEGRKPRIILSKPVVSFVSSVTKADGTISGKTKSSTRNSRVSNASTKRFCGKCGSKIIDGNQFCTSCGAKIK